MSLLLPVQKIPERVQTYIQDAAAKRVPMRGSIELTHRCNLACVHCYVNLPAADRAAQRREMTTGQIERLLDELADVGLLILTITGGEPLLRPDFARIYRYAHEKGILINVYTNATLITDRIVELFRELPPLKVDVTMYGFTPGETYDRVADAGEGQWARWKRGLDKLLAGGVRVGLKTMAMRSTRDEVQQMSEFAAGLGLDFRMDSTVNPRIDGGRGPLAERLTAAEIVALEMATQKQRAAWADFCSTRIGEAPANDALYQCGAGQAAFLVDPYGRLHVCELSRKPGWDVLEHGFARGWYEAFPALRETKRTHDAGCGSCATHATCNNCVGMAELEGRAYEDGNPYFCETTDARNEAALGENRARPNGLIRLRLPDEMRQSGSGL